MASAHDDHVVRYWQIIKANNAPYLQLIWSNHQNVLLSQDACIENVRGLSVENTELLIQRGAIKKLLLLSDSAKTASGIGSSGSNRKTLGQINTQQLKADDGDKDQEKKCVIS